jgi:dTDP-4-dehydrorhamnose reductase
MGRRILITGAGGMLGQDVVDAADQAGLTPIALAHAELDIADWAEAREAIDATEPDVVINCAAWTDVDGAEANEAVARAVNGAGAGNVARAANARGAHTIHISSDYVFDGAKRSPYVESDAPAPLSAYGRSKLAGEEAVAREAPGRHTIVRSSWLFGVRGPCFPATILQLARDRDELAVVDDQRGSPTYTRHLAAALVALAGQPPSGLIHLAGAGACTWFEFAGAIIESARLATAVTPSTTAEQRRPAPRPPYSVLGSERGAFPLPDWRAGLADYMAARTAMGAANP